MSNKERMLHHLAHHNGIITYKDCKTLGIPTVYLTRLEQEGTIFRVEKGIYLDANGDYDDYYFFQYRFSKAIYSYTSALYLLGVTDEIPQYFEVTVPRGYRFNTPPSNLLIHTTTKKFIEIGVTRIKTLMGNYVQAYDLERTICDLIINRNHIDTELFVKTLQSYAKNPNKNIGKLYDYATKMQAIKDIKQTLEVLM